MKFGLVSYFMTPVTFPKKNAPSFKRNILGGSEEPEHVMANHWLPVATPWFVYPATFKVRLLLEPGKDL